MSKQSGLGDQLLVSGYVLGGDVQALGNISGGNSPLNVTGITKSAHERIGGRRDGAIEYTTFFNPAPDQAHERLSALPTGDQLVTYLRGEGIGRPAACLNSRQIGYDGSRADDGALTFSVSAQANGYGLEWCTQLTDGIRTDAAATAGTSVDLGTGSTAHGLQAYLHVVSFTGTDVTITIEESSDDAAADAWAPVTGGAFMAVDEGPTWERLETARDQTVERYLRVTTSTTGGFTDLQFCVLVARNDVETRF
ncbi:hypothetical protein LHJ74_14745 [Streptomyces sp. N2-109]|uniref:Uncharacterized protein n=1 Tax=Streptomyces gossypii TaxID=2883101 RepID=A0ABT2JTF0_9ACTN|nr:hypothetical protein [Streptomyces gossypii]MCT2591150.1 hypothetical protein [Streptomyces gossypii]